MCIPTGLDFDGCFTQSNATLNQWLSILNGAKVEGHEDLPKAIERESIIAELEARRKHEENSASGQIKNYSSGYDGKDWREYENEDGYTHFEELLIHQPTDWKEQARAYLHKYKFDIARESQHPYGGTKTKRLGWSPSIVLPNPLVVVLFHQNIAPLDRYESLGLLLSYGVTESSMKLKKWREKLRRDWEYDDGFPVEARSWELVEYPMAYTYFELSPLRYLWDLRNTNRVYKTDALFKRGQDLGVPRLGLLNELTFSPVVGQRLAKARITKLILGHFGRRFRGQGTGGPLFMSFIGPSATGKTALACEVANLLTHPKDNGMLHLKYGNNDRYATFKETAPLIRDFFQRMSKTPERVGVVVLDGLLLATEFVHGYGLDYDCILGAVSPNPDNIIVILKDTCTRDILDYDSACEIVNDDARIDALVSGRKIQAHFSSNTRLYPTGFNNKESVVPFVALTRAERIAKTMILLENNGNAEGLTHAVKHRFAEYIADKYDYCDKDLVASVLRAQIDYWHVLAD